LLSEFGLILPQGIAHLYQRVPVLLDEAKEELPGAFRELVQRLLEHLKELDRQVGEMEVQIQVWHRSNALSRKLEKIPGIGPITASALVASIGDAKNFTNGRQLAAWLAACRTWGVESENQPQRNQFLPDLQAHSSAMGQKDGEKWGAAADLQPTTPKSDRLLGLVPKQHSSGGKANLQRISKRGDTYLRTLLIHGARAVIRYAERKADAQGWLHKLIGRRNKNVAAVALANKNARIVWALLAREREFRFDCAGA
jgi:transposase